MTHMVSLERSKSVQSVAIGLRKTLAVYSVVNLKSTASHLLWSGMVCDPQSTFYKLKKSSKQCKEGVTRLPTSCQGIRNHQAVFHSTDCFVLIDDTSLCSQHWATPRSSPSITVTQTLLKDPILLALLHILLLKLSHAADSMMSSQHNTSCPTVTNCVYPRSLHSWDARKPDATPLAEAPAPARQTCAPHAVLRRRAPRHGRASATAAPHCITLTLCCSNPATTCCML
jgi:hypothetical protein